MRVPGTPAVGPLPPLADTWRRSFVELLGTFALVFFGAGTIMALGPQADAGTLEVALATGLAVACMVAAVGHISGLSTLSRSSPEASWPRCCSGGSSRP